jgi:hypothetical protein
MPGSLCGRQLAFNNELLRVRPALGSRQPKTPFPAPILNDPIGEGRLGDLVAGPPAPG